MPPPVLLAALVVLIGWPLGKLIATVVSRPLWDRQRVICEQLLTARNASSDERMLIKQQFDEGKGSPLFLAMPAVLLFGGIAAALSPDSIQDVPDSMISVERIYELQHGGEATAKVRDLIRSDGFRELSDRSFALLCLRYPFCCIASSLALVPAALIFLVRMGFTASWRAFLASAVSGSRRVVAAYEHPIGSAPRTC